MLITVIQLSIALGSALGGVLINAHGVATVSSWAEASQYSRACSLPVWGGGERQKAG